jgi:hypothetical protein
VKDNRQAGPAAIRVEGLRYSTAEHGQVAELERGTTVKIGYIIASNRVAKDRKPIGYLYRERPDDENDSGWRVFSGEETREFADDPANFAMYNASTILEIDPSIKALLACPAPVAFLRDPSGDFVAVEGPHEA